MPIDAPTGKIRPLKSSWNDALGPAFALGAGASFYPIQSLTSATNTMTGAEYRKHMVTDLGNFDMPRSYFEPSTVIVGNLRVSSLSTVAADTIGVLSVDFHYQSGPVGTDTEYV